MVGLCGSLKSTAANLMQAPPCLGEANAMITSDVEHHCHPKIQTVGQHLLPDITTFSKIS